MQSKKIFFTFVFNRQCRCRKYKGRQRFVHFSPLVLYSSRNYSNSDWQSLTISSLTKSISKLLKKFRFLVEQISYPREPSWITASIYSCLLKNSGKKSKIMSKRCMFFCLCSSQFNLPRNHQVFASQALNSKYKKIRNWGL